jgi:hypothetical protein
MYRSRQVFVPYWTHQKRYIWYTSESFLHNWHFQCHRLIASSTTLERKKNTRDKYWGQSQHLKNKNWTRKLNERISLIRRNKPKPSATAILYTVAQWGTDVGALTHQKWTGMSRVASIVPFVFLFFSGLPRPAKDRDDVDWRRLHVADRLSLHMMECLHPPTVSLEFAFSTA